MRSILALLTSLMLLASAGLPELKLEVKAASSMLFVRMPARELKVEGVSGDQDVELHAGDLSITIGSAGDYARVDASVITADLDDRRRPHASLTSGLPEQRPRTP